MSIGRATPLHRIPFTAMHVRQKAFLVGPSHAFVRDPKTRGRWVLVPRPVVEKACTWCDAAVFEPCRNPKRGNTWTSIHIARRVSHFERNQRIKDARRKVKA